MLWGSKQAIMMLGLISRYTNFKSTEVMKILYTAFVRPHLEHAIRFQSPNYFKDQNLIEKIQRWVSK